jgi:hypothetical protein
MNQKSNRYKKATNLNKKNQNQDLMNNYKSKEKINLISYQPNSNKSKNLDNLNFQYLRNK